MKKTILKLSIFSMMLFAVVSCSNGNNSSEEDNSSTLENASGENKSLNSIYMRSDNEMGYYFFDNDTCLVLSKNDYNNKFYGKVKKYIKTGDIITIGDSKYKLADKALLNLESIKEDAAYATFLKTDNFDYFLK